MVRRLLQRLDQVVSVLRIYGPQRAFAYALKDKRDERDVIGSAIGGPQRHNTNRAQRSGVSQQVPMPKTPAQSPDPVPRFLFTKPPVHTAKVLIFPQER